MVCARDKEYQDNKIKTCAPRWSQQEGTKVGDARVCKSAVATVFGYCSNIKETFQRPKSTNSSSNGCDINALKGMCEAVLSYDNQINNDFISCQCTMSDNHTAFCRWPGLNTHLKLYSQALKLYQNSYTCPRSVLVDDPLSADFMLLK